MFQSNRENVILKTQYLFKKIKMTYKNPFIKYNRIVNVMITFQ